MRAALSIAADAIGLALVWAAILYGLPLLAIIMGICDPGTIC